MPISTPSSPAWSVAHALLFAFRLPIFLFFTTLYLLTIHHLPLPPAFRKICLWSLMAIPGIWWVDLQIDGVKRGGLASSPRNRVPYPGSVIAASWTSPLDVMYLAAVFDPIFTVSYAGSRKVRRVGLLGALVASLTGPGREVPKTGMTDVGRLVRENPGRIVAVFPEGSTTNGRGVLPLTPSLTTVPADKRIFAVSLRYTPPDITTPVPGLGGLAGFLWKLLSRPWHQIRVRIAEGCYNDAGMVNGIDTVNGDDTSGNIYEVLGDDGIGGDVSVAEQKVLDKVAENLARLGRAKRVGLTLGDKVKFVEAWGRKGRR